MLSKPTQSKRISPTYPAVAFREGGSVVIFAVLRFNDSRSDSPEFVTENIFDSLTGHGRPS
jgi:hypothetical protein